MAYNTLPYAVEFVGTFFFLSVILASAGNPLAIGVALAAAIYLGGHISGGHFNPAVTTMMAYRGVLSKVDAIAYIGAQVAAGIGALLAYQKLYHRA
jgi:aquaporin Z